MPVYVNCKSVYIPRNSYTYVFITIEANTSVGKIQVLLGKIFATRMEKQNTHVGGIFVNNYSNRLALCVNKHTSHI